MLLLAALRHYCIQHSVRTAQATSAKSLHDTASALVESFHQTLKTLRRFANHFCVKCHLTCQFDDCLITFYGTLPSYSFHFLQTGRSLFTNSLTPCQRSRVHASWRPVASGLSIRRLAIPKMQSPLAVRTRLTPIFVFCYNLTSCVSATV